MAHRRLTTAAAAVAVLVAGCGTPAPSKDEAAAITVLVDDDLSADEQRCILDGLADLELPVERILADDLDADETGDVLAVSVECVDDLATVEAFVDSFIAGAAEEGTTLTRDEARCAIRALDGDDQPDAITACLGDRLGSGGDFGDDEVLDLLVEQCRRGNDQACDELAISAPVGGEYEAFARTCGGRDPEGANGACFNG